MNDLRDYRDLEVWQKSMVIVRRMLSVLMRSLRSKR